MAKILGKCPICSEIIPLNDEKETGFCSKCGNQVNVRECVDLYIADNETESSLSTNARSTRRKSPTQTINELFQLCSSEDEFLGLRQRILEMDVDDSTKVQLLALLDERTAQRLEPLFAQEKEYNEAHSTSFGSYLIGCVAIFVIGCFFGRKGIIIGSVLVILAFIGRYSEMQKTKNFATAVKLLQKYRSLGYHI
ncbi:MAG: hypothetical protein IKC24_04250 [Oscillospiraceae bacterium]|nr:hypothetical protein [Oscillospiraceae bacterium]